MSTENRVDIDVTKRTSVALVSYFTLVKESNKLRPQSSETPWPGQDKTHGCVLIENYMGTF